MVNKNKINQIIDISRREINENLIYEYNFTPEQQRIIINYFDKLFKNLKREILWEVEQ